MLMQNLGYPRIGGQRQLKKPVSTTGQAKSAKRTGKPGSPPLTTCPKYRGNGIVAEQSRRPVTRLKPVGEPGLWFEDPQVARNQSRFAAYGSRS